MYHIHAQIEGVAPLLQHRYPMPTLEELSGRHRSRRQTGAPDYSQEWRQSLYVNARGEIYQPAAHLENAMARAAANFKITGKRGKSYRELFTSSVFVTPEELTLGITAPTAATQLTTDPEQPLYLDCRPVVVQKSRVVRIRPALATGWHLDFTIEVFDDEVPLETVEEVLTLAGKTVGIGDYRPKFGRFRVAQFTRME